MTTDLSVSITPTVHDLMTAARYDQIWGHMGRMQREIAVRELVIGACLAYMHDTHLWAQRHETWGEFLEDLAELEISRRTAERYIQVYRAFVPPAADPDAETPADLSARILAAAEEVARMGISRAAIIAPVIADPQVPEQTKLEFKEAAARGSTPREDLAANVREQRTGIAETVDDAARHQLARWLHVAADRLPYTPAFQDECEQIIKRLRRASHEWRPADPVVAAVGAVLIAGDEARYGNVEFIAPALDAKKWAHVARVVEALGGDTALEIAGASVRAHRDVWAQNNAERCAVYGFAPAGYPPERFAPDFFDNTPEELAAWFQCLGHAAAGEPIRTEPTQPDHPHGCVAHQGWGMGTWLGSSDEYDPWNPSSPVDAREKEWQPV